MFLKEAVCGRLWLGGPLAYRVQILQGLVHYIFFFHHKILPLRVRSVSEANYCRGGVQIKSVVNLDFVLCFHNDSDLCGRPLHF